MKCSQSVGSVSFSLCDAKKKDFQSIFMSFSKSLSHRLLCFDFLVFTTGCLLGWTFLWSTERGSSCSCAFVCRCLGVNTDSGGPPRLFSALLKKHILPFASAPNELLRSSRFFSQASQNCQKSGILWQDDAAILCHTILFISVFIFIITSSILQIYFLCKHVRGFQQHRSQNCPAPGVLAALFVVLPRATHPFDTGSTRQQQGHSCDSYPDWWFWSIALITVVQHVVHLSFLVGRRERDRRKESDGWQWLN